MPGSSHSLCLAALPVVHCLCMGSLLGLYKFERESTSEFKDWALDAPISFAWVVLDVWKTGSPGQSDLEALKTFIEDRLDGWSAHYL